MLEFLIAVAVLIAFIRYAWVSMRRDITEERETSVAEALDSIRAALPVEVRASDFAPLAAADAEVSRRPRVPAITTPISTIKRIS